MWGEGTVVRKLLLFWLLLPIPCWGGAVRVTPQPLDQGGVGWVEVRAKGEVKGEFLKRSLPFFRTAEETWRALIGVDLALSPGSYPLKVETEGKRVTLFVRVKKTPFGLQKVTLPRHMVELRGEALERVRREKGMLREIFSRIRSEPLWRGSFLLPLKGTVTTPFGVRRIINGHYRSFHSGVDIAAREGSPILATNDGMVILAQKLYLEGNTVIIDHGLGLYSIYLHLAKAFVRKGDKVKRGERIGLVGATGRVTGPHLHWGIKLLGQRVDPMALIELSKGLGR